MSRYFTCPPLVYAGNQASGQNLVESTKLERIIVDSKKAHRKEKKEKRKQKKEKHDKSHKYSKKAIKQQYLPTKETVDECEQLEKSGLTEELEEPQKLGYLSDGSQNSKKRKRENSPPAVESVVKAARVAGNPLRIRFIFKKPKEDAPSVQPEDLVCSTSEKESLGDKEKVLQEAIANPISCSKISELEENLPSTSVALIAETKKIKKHKKSKEERYNALFDDWAPSSISLVAMEDQSKDDDDWLFGSRTQEKRNPKASVKIDEEMQMNLSRAGGSCWPKAQFLSEVGIYALPYAIPF